MCLDCEGSALVKLRADLPDELTVPTGEPEDEKVCSRIPGVHAQVC